MMKQIFRAILTGAITLTSLIANAQNINSKSIDSINSIYNKENKKLIINDSIRNETIKNTVYPYKNSRPTTAGINKYVLDQSETVIFDFQKFFKVQIDNMDFEADNLQEYNIDDKYDYDTILNNKGNDDKNNNQNKNTLQLTTIPVSELTDEYGIYYWNWDYAVISNEEKYIGYSVKTTKKSILSNIYECNEFIRAAMIHELAHDYFKQIIDELKYEQAHISPEYKMQNDNALGSNLIIEGVAEYCSVAMNEVISVKPKKVYRPKKIDEILDKKNKYKVYYEYGSIYVGDFIKSNSLHSAIRILVTNPSPTIEEIINPEKYFSRLNRQYK